jgi:chromosome segregation ATPase
MCNSTILKSVVTASLLAWMVSPALAQGRGRGGGRTGGVQIGVGGGQQNQQAMQQQITQIGQQLQQGETALREATEKATEARTEWQKVDALHKQNLRELAQAKKGAEEEAKNSPDLKAAKEKLENLRGQLGEVRKKVIETLKKENEGYQQAVKVHEQVLAEQKANSGPNVSSDTRRALAKKVSDADKNLKATEDVVMADNTEAKELQQQIKEATAELGAASKRKTEAIESDPKLSSAKVAFQRTRDDLKKATTDRDQADGEANRIRSAMQALSNQRASLQNQIQAQQRMQQGGNGYGNQNGNQGGVRIGAGR